MTRETLGLNLLCRQLCVHTEYQLISTICKIETVITFSEEYFENQMKKCM